MELVVSNSNINLNESGDNKLECKIIKEFDDFSRVIELTNVFQLQVDKAKIHLENLRKSLMKTNDCVKQNEDLKDSIKESVELANLSLKDELSLITGDLSVNNYINPSEKITLSDLLTNTCLLISRLELDRCTIEEEIFKQKLKVEELLQKINSISFFRMEMLPSAVQKEHEACSNDISELQWHIKHRTQIEKKLRQKRNKAADINTELLEEIESIKEHIPLVQEKLNLEESMMSKIQETKDNLIEESEASAERQRITKEKHDEANKKVESERQHINRDLNKANKALNKIQKALQHGEKEYIKLLDFRARSEEKIRQNNSEIIKLNADNESKKMEQSNLEETVNKLDRKYREIQFDSKRLSNTLKERAEFLVDQEVTQEEKRCVVKKIRDDLDQNLVNLKRTNKQMEIEIKEMKESEEKIIEESEKLRSRITNSKEDIREAEKRYECAVDEFSAMSRDHGAVQQRLSLETRRIHEAEDQLRKALNDLEQNIKKEILTKANFETKIVKDSQDLDNSKKESLNKEKQMQKALNEALSMTEEARNKVAEMESQHQIINGEKKKLESEYVEIMKSIESTKSEKKAIIDNLTPIFNDLKSKLDILVQKEELVEWQIQTMNSQLIETTRSEKLIVKSKKKIQESLLDLENNYNDLALNLEISRKQVARSEEIISQITSQFNRFQKVHEKYLESRRQVSCSVEKELEEALLLNRSLAAQYRSLQTDFYSMQDGFLDVIQEQLWGEGSVKDIKEVQRLQKFMHSNMEIFFGLKLMYDDHQFDNLRQENGRSEEKVKQLSDKYSKHIEQLTEFLRNNFQNDYQIITNCN